jgi:hypothetical protein
MTFGSWMESHLFGPEQVSMLSSTDLPTHDERQMLAQTVVNLQQMRDRQRLQGA